jgi:hypothetical protein
MIYKLSAAEQDRLRLAIVAALNVPFIAGIEGYVWESIFHYVKGLPLPNPHANTRRKLLFDAVDSRKKIGWSLKAVQKSPTVESTFEVVIQRADVIKKRTLLGFPDLALENEPNELGKAVLSHWNGKIGGDMEAQGVTKPRVAILLKSRDHRRYALLEQDLRRFKADELIWSWTDATHNGLQARYQGMNSVALRWYPNQKQLFEVFTLSAECYQFEIKPERVSPEELIRLLSKAL